MRVGDRVASKDASLPGEALVSKSVSLRRWELTDLQAVEEAAGDRSLLQGTTLPSPYTPEEGAAFIARQWRRQTSGEGLSLAIALNGRAVGCATLMIRRPGVVDFGYWLVGPARGAGVGTRAVALLVDWVVGLPDVEAVEAFVADDNIPSQKLLSRLGFRYTGRQRHQVNDLDQELRVYRRNTAVLGLL
jgi:RimJ/RimL family protein N-acetyltransferase